MAGGRSIPVLITLALLAAAVNTDSSACYCTATSTICNDSDGKSFIECPNSFALYISNSALDALSRSNLERLPDLLSFHVENSWSVKELPSDLLDPLVKIQDIYITNSSAFLRIGDMLHNNLEVTNLILISNDISKIESRMFQKLPRLRKVDFSKNKIANIKSSPPQEYGTFSNLTELQFINLRGNKISHIHKNAFVCIRHIVELDISNNEIEEIERGAFELDGIPSITVNISQNKIKHVLDSTFSSCDAVTYLDLSFNLIEDLHPGAFLGLTKCKMLVLKNNYLGEVSSSVFSPLKSLQELDLRKNKLQKLLGDQFGASTSLRVVNLSGNEITTIHPKTFRGLSSLEELNLDNNKLIGLGNSFSVFLPNLLLINMTKNKLPALSHSVFRGCIKLKTLDLSGNAISAIEDGAFLNNGHLENLLLNNNYLSCIKCNSFEGLFSLQKLSLEENNLDLLSYLSFQHLNNLKTLILHPVAGNPCSCASIAKLKDANVYVDIEKDTFNSLCGDYIYISKNKASECNETCCSYENSTSFATPAVIYEKDSIDVTDTPFTHMYELPYITQVSFHEEEFTVPIYAEQQRIEEKQHKQNRENTREHDKSSFSLSFSTFNLGVNSTKSFTAQERDKTQLSSHEEMQKDDNTFQNNIKSLHGDDDQNKLLQRKRNDSHYKERPVGNISEKNSEKLIKHQEQYEQNQIGYLKNDRHGRQEHQPHEQIQLQQQNTITSLQTKEVSMVHILAIAVIVAGLAMCAIVLGFTARVVYKKWRLRSHVYEEIGSPLQKPNSAQMVLLPPGISA